MKTYLVRRLGLFALTLLGVSIGIFLVMRVLPGDPALAVLTGPEGQGNPDPVRVEALREEMGLNRPLVVQYLAWVGDVARGDFGRSLYDKRPVSELLRDAVPVTLELTLLTTVLSLMVGVPLGLLSAIRRNRLEDFLARSIALIGLAAPNFWVGTVILMVLATQFDWLPPIRYAGPMDNLSVHVQQMIWPVLTIAFAQFALITRITRSAVLEELPRDYMRTARAKGLPASARIIRHLLRNASLPILTLAGLSIATAMQGAVITEVLFRLPGTGRVLVTAIGNRDFPIVQTMVLFFAAFVLMVNLMVDMLYSVLDPRIRYD